MGGWSLNWTCWALTRFSNAASSLFGPLEAGEIKTFAMVEQRQEAVGLIRAALFGVVTVRLVVFMEFLIAVRSIVVVLRANKSSQDVFD